MSINDNRMLLSRAIRQVRNKEKIIAMIRLQVDNGLDVMIRLQLGNSVTDRHMNNEFESVMRFITSRQFDDYIFLRNRGKLMMF